MAKPRAKQKKKQFNQQSSKTEDVFKVKNNAPKKSKNIANKIKTKSRQALRQGYDVLDDTFVQLHQQQLHDISHDKVQCTGRAKQTVDVEDAVEQLTKL